MATELHSCAPNVSVSIRVCVVCLFQFTPKLVAFLVDCGNHQPVASPNPINAASDNCRLASMVSGTASETPIA